MAYSGGVFWPFSLAVRKLRVSAFEQTMKFMELYANVAGKKLLADMGMMAVAAFVGDGQQIGPAVAGDVICHEVLPVDRLAAPVGE